MLNVINIDHALKLKEQNNFILELLYAKGVEKTELNIPEEYLADKDFIKKVIKFNINIYNNIPDKLKIDRNFNLELARLNGMVIKYFIPKFKSDKEIVLVASQSNYKSLEYSEIITSNIEDENLKNLKNVDDDITSSTETETETGNSNNLKEKDNLDKVSYEKDVVIYSKFFNSAFNKFSNILKANYPLHNNNFFYYEILSTIYDTLKAENKNFSLARLKKLTKTGYIMYVSYFFGFGTDDIGVFQRIYKLEQEDLLYCVMNEKIFLILEKDLNQQAFLYFKNINRKYITEDNTIKDTLADIKFEIGNSTFVAKKVTNHTFDNLIGLSNIKDRLKEMAGFYTINDSIKEQFKIKQSKGFILYGKPGTGKTSLIKAFANYCNYYFIYITVSALQGFVDRNDKTIMSDFFDKVNDLAKAEKVIVFLDEFDSIGVRGEASNNNSWIQTFINELLYYIDNLPQNCIIAGGTNYKANIDPALTRDGRLDVVIEIKNQFTKEEVIMFLDNILFPESKYNSFIANFIFFETGGTIESIVNKIKINFAQNGKLELLCNSYNNIEIENSLMDIIYREKYQVYKEIDFTKKNVISTAYHEAAHAGIHKLLYPEIDIAEISIYPTKDALGFVRYVDMEHIVDIEDYKKMVMILMAGKIAEEIFYGISSMGAMSDLQKLNDITYNMFYKAGFSTKGNIVMDLKYKNETISNFIEDERIKYINNLYIDCKKILVDNKIFFDAIVELLLEKKVIHNNDICLIYETYKSDTKDINCRFAANV